MVKLADRASRGLRLASRVVFLGAILAPAPVPALAASGDLDLAFAGFGVSGKVFRDISTSCMALQPDGGIVVAGNTGVSLIVTRYLANGAPDPTFGPAGGTVTHLNPQFAILPTSVAVQADGKVVVAGWAEDRVNDDFLVVRLLTNGALDPSFGAGGYVTTDFNGHDDIPHKVLIRSDGRIVLAGTAGTRLWDEFAAARYHTDGSLDATFGGDGTVAIDFGGEHDRCWDAALDGDGRLVLVGHHDEVDNDYDIAVARLGENGALDNTFDGDGKATTGLGDYEVAYAVAIQGDGRIIAAGNKLGGDGFLVRYLDNGDRDPSFGSGGTLTLNSDLIADVAVQPDGRILHFGIHYTPGGDRQLGFHRSNPDGSPDLTFAANGRLFVDVGVDDSGKAIALQADGRIIGYGTTGTGPAPNTTCVLIRLWPDGSFDDGGRQTLGLEDPFLGAGSNETAYGAALQADGKIVVAGQVFDARFNEANFALARFHGDGRPDASFGTSGWVSFGFGGEEMARAVAIQRDGKIVAAGSSRVASGSNFMVARFRADGTPDPEFALFGFNVLDFFGGNDFGNAVAVTPDDKIVVAGSAFNGARDVFGVVRLFSDGTPDGSFDLDGKQLFEFALGLHHWASAVVVQPDRKIVVGGTAGGDFALVRFNEDGGLDATFGLSGATRVDMGGDDFLSALVMREGSDWLLAAGTRFSAGNGDFALAQFLPNGLQPTGGPGSRSWPGGKAFVDLGGVEAAQAVDWRRDGQVVVAGCGESAGSTYFVWAELPPASLVPPVAVTGTTAFVGDDTCAFGIKYYRSNKVILVGGQRYNGERNIALSRFEVSQRIGDQAFVRGDCNSDGTVDISDASCLLNWLFLGGSTPFCGAAVDSNGDAGVDVSDVSYVLNFLFLGGPRPAAPYPDCGTSELPSDDVLGCAGTSPRCS